MKSQILHITAITAISVLLGSLNYSSFTASAKCNINSMKMNTMLVPEFSFDEENYIDDIPFSTEEVVENYDYQNTLNVGFCFEDEKYIDDIPFNTEEIANIRN